MRRLTCAMVFRTRVISSLIIASVFLASSGEAEIIDRIVAIVNDEIITLSELEEFRKSFYRDGPENNDWLDSELDLMDLRLRALNTLIEEKLIDQEATRQRINVTEKQVADTIESIRKEQRMSKKQLEMALEGTGLTFEDYKRQVEKGLKRSRLINRVVKSKIEIKEEDLRTYYQTHLEDYMADESVRISHILLPLPANPTENQEDGILLIAEDIMRTGQGKDFAGLAHQYAKDLPGAKGGDLGYFKKGELVPALDRMAFRLRVGQVGEPIRTQEGIILIKVTDRKGGSPIPLDQIKKKVERDYQNSQTEQLYRQWIRKLRERSFIEVKL